MDPIIIIGAGLLAYLLWSQSQGASGGLPADAAFISQVAAGTAAAVPQSWASGASAAPGTVTTAISYLYYGPSENTYYLVATAPTAAQTAAGAALTPISAPAPAQTAGQLLAPAFPAPATTPAAPATGTVFPTCGPNNTPPCTCPAGYIFQNTFNVAGAAPGVTTPTCVPGVSGLRGLSGSIRSPYWT